MTTAAPRIVDLHAHFPMHFYPLDEEADRSNQLAEFLDNLSEREKHLLLVLGGFVMNNWYQGKPRVDLDSMQRGGVESVLSVLYPFFDEIDGATSDALVFPLRWPAPKSSYFDELLRQMTAVEARVSHFGDTVAVVRNWEELTNAKRNGKLSVLHAVEGGFVLGSTPGEMSDRVRVIAELGVAYVTVAHLFFRGVAANAAPIPNVPWILRLGRSSDQWCHENLPVPSDTGLTALGASLVNALIDNGVLVDLTHLSGQAIDETLDLLDQRDPDALIPVLVSHGAYRFGTREYNLTESQIVRIAKRKGTIGLLVCKDFMGDGLTEHRAFPVMLQHIQKIGEIVEGARIPGVGRYDCVSIGTDLDGFIEPLQDINTISDLKGIASQLMSELPQHAEAICRDNAYRLLRSGVEHGKPVGTRMPWAPVL